MRPLPAAERVAVPWRNGTGSTREIIAVGGEEFDWRLSIAEVVGATEFSRFPNVDRFLVPLSPAGLHLVVDDAPVDLAEWQVLEFAGEQSVRTGAETGATEDLNLMLRRGITEAALSVSRLRGSAEFEATEGEQVVVVLLEGAATCGDDALERHDALLLAASERTTIEGDAVVAIARVTTR